MNTPSVRPSVHPFLTLNAVLLQRQNSGQSFASLEKPHSDLWRCECPYSYFSYIYWLWHKNKAFIFCFYDFFLTFPLDFTAHSTTSLTSSFAEWRRRAMIEHLFTNRNEKFFIFKKKKIVFADGTQLKEDPSISCQMESVWGKKKSLNDVCEPFCLWYMDKTNEQFPFISFGSVTSIYVLFTCKILLYWKNPKHESNRRCFVFMLNAYTVDSAQRYTLKVTLLTPSTNQALSICNNYIQHSPLTMSCTGISVAQWMRIFTQMMLLQISGEIPKDRFLFKCSFCLQVMNDTRHLTAGWGQPTGFNSEHEYPLYL